MNRVALPLLIAFFAASLGARPAYADEEAEGAGFSFELPEGFSKLFDSNDAEEPLGGGLSFPKFTMGGFGTPVETEMMAFVRGPRHEPEGVILVLAGRLEEEATQVTQADLDDVRAEVNRSVGSDVDLRVLRAAGPNGYDAIEVIFDLGQIPEVADAGVEGRAWMLAVPAGQYAVFLLYMNMDPDVEFEARAEWDALKVSLQVDPPTTPEQAIMYALIGAGVLGLLYLGLRCFQSAGENASLSEADHGALGVDPGDPDSARIALGAVGATTSKPTAPAPSGLRSTFDYAPPKRPPPPPSAEPRTAPASEGSGLRATLPASGRWSDNR